MERIYNVNIGGFDLKLYSGETEAEMMSLVKAVNRRIAEYEKSSKGCTKINAILLTCMELCQENRELKDKRDALQKKVSDLRAKAAGAKKDAKNEG